MRVYYFIEARWAVEDIARRRLKACRFLDLNDPFELFAADLRNRDLRPNLKARAVNLNEEFGLLCFTEGWHDPLMWSHYGDRHKGMCLGFDVVDSMLTPINYNRKRLKVSLAEWNAARADNPLLRTKSARWVYEKEQRLIVPLEDLCREDGLLFRRFDPGLKLVQVIAGPRCCVEFLSEIKDKVAILPTRPELIKARLAFRTFRVVADERGIGNLAAWQACGDNCSQRKFHGPRTQP